MDCFSSGCVRNVRRAVFRVCIGLILLFEVSVVASPYPVEVVDFTPGPGGPEGYDNPNVVLGPPPVQDSLGYAISTTSAPWEANDVVSLGNGGSLTVRFDDYVFNNPLDVEYGVDLIVFGNSFFGLDSWPDGVINQLYGEPAKIEVSQNGLDFYEIPSVFADELYPYTSLVGSFLKASPSGIDFLGRHAADVEADFAGGCGGAQVDISAALGVTEPLDWVQYVRVTDIADDSGIADVVAFSDVVPEPATIVLVFTGAAFLRSRGRK